MNQFAWWPTVNEKFQDSIETAKAPLVDLDWKEINHDWVRLYWDLPNKKEIEKIRIKEIKESISKRVKSIPEFPIIENLYISKEISEESFLDIIEQIENASNKDEVLELITIFIKNNIKNKDSENKVIDYFNKKEKIDEKNFEKSDFFRESKKLNIKIDSWIWWLEIMLAENYINIWWEDIDKSSNLISSMEISLNKLIENKNKDFLDNNADLIEKIRKEINPESKYKLLKDLYKNYLVDDYKFWWTKIKKEIERKKIDIEEKSKRIKDKLNEQLKNNKISIEEADKKWEKAKEELKIEWIENNNLEKITEWWDIFENSEEEKIQETVEK